MQRGAGGAGPSRPRDGGTGGGRAHGPGDGLRDDAGTLPTRTPGGRDQRCRDPPHEDPGADGCDGETHVFSQFLFNDSSVPGDPRRQAERDQTGGRATHCPARAVQRPHAALSGAVCQTGLPFWGRSSWGDVSQDGVIPGIPLVLESPQEGPRRGSFGASQRCRAVWAGRGTPAPGVRPPVNSAFSAPGAQHKGTAAAGPSMPSQGALSQGTKTLFRAPG